jgi:glutathione S-transferase
MKLVGRYGSPYTRRVAATMNLYGLPFEHLPLGSREQPEEVARFHPMGRVPALVLDDGEVLIDSAAIIDHLDELVGRDRALTPPSGAERRAVLRCVAFAINACDKAVVALIEKSRRPPDKVWPEALERPIRQARIGFAWLDEALTSDWLVLGRMTQADVTSAVVLTAIDRVMPEITEGRFPRLAALRDRMGAVAEFAATAPS